MKPCLENKNYEYDSKSNSIFSSMNYCLFKKSMRIFSIDQIKIYFESFYLLHFYIWNLFISDTCIKKRSRFYLLNENSVLQSEHVFNTSPVYRKLIVFYNKSVHVLKTAAILEIWFISQKFRDRHGGANVTCSIKGTVMEFNILRFRNCVSKQRINIFFI